MFMRFYLFVAFLIVGLDAIYNKLIFNDCGSQGVDIQQTDLTPMPVVNPGVAHFTFVARLKRPVKTLETKLDIIRTVSGITLPVRCYKVDGKDVGSCTYPSLCKILQDLLDNFTPETCSPTLFPFGIDCRCPFKIDPQQLNIIKEEITIPDASKSAASFLVSGDFNVTITARDLDNGAVAQPYGCGKIAFTSVQAKPGK